MSPLTLLAALSLLLLSTVFPSTSAFSLGSGTCYATAAAVTAGTGKHPITPQLGFYLSGLPTQYKENQEYEIVITNTKNNPSITYFNGFLLYAVDYKGNRQGTFQVDSKTAATTDMAWAQEATLGTTGKHQCHQAPDATITHNSAGQKPIGSLTLRWSAPPQNVGPLVWHGLVETSAALQYTQVLTPWTQCDANNNTCTAFDPKTLPSGALPPPPTPSNVQPFGLSAIDASACGSFAPITLGALPPGFCASVYATPNRPRGMYVTDQGDILVVETGTNPTGISVLRDVNRNGVIDVGESTRILSAPSLNHGLYVHNGYMYFSSPNTVWRLPFNSKNATNPLYAAQATVVVKGIPGGGHATRTPLVSHDNRWLYVSVGSQGNLDNDDSRSRVVRYDLTQAIPAGGWQWNDYNNPSQAIQAFAKGLRNEVGLALDLHGEVWGVMNADDNLNRPDLGGYNIHNDNPAERVDHLREGDMIDGWYGYPYCWAADILANHSNGDIFAWGGDGKDWYKDGEHTDEWCRENAIPPSYALQAHTAPLGLVFYDGRGRYAFPPEYYNQIFVAEHGSWNSDTPRGYKIARIGTDERGEALASTSRDFFAYKGPGAAWPNSVRPVEVRVGPEGEMYVSSDTNSQIIVIRHINDRHTPVLMPQLVSSGYNYSTIGGPTKATAEFSFDVPRTGGTYRWTAGSYPRTGVAQFDGASLYVNMTAADNNAGANAPNITGGNSTYEMWVNIDPVSGADYVILELLEPGTTPAQDDYFRILATVRPGSNSSTASIRAVSQQPGQSEATFGSMQMRTGQWNYLVLVFTSSPYGTTARMQIAATSIVDNTFSVPTVKARRSALLGHSYRYTQTGTLSNFTGYLDDVRLYSYALSATQTSLNYLLSDTDRTNPVLQANLHMQPPENAEATYSHRGPANRYGPQPAANLVPGWIALDGSQFVNLSNPMSGVGHAWSGQLFDSDNAMGASMSIELWFHLDDPTKQPTTEVPLVNAQPLLRMTWSKELQVRIGGSSYTAPLDMTSTTGWTHVVFTVGPGVGGQSTYATYINGSSNPQWQKSGPLFKPDPVTVASLGGDAQFGSDKVVGMRGEIAIFRVYDVALKAAHVSALYSAQVTEGQRMQYQARALGLPSPITDSDDSSDSFPVLSAGAIVGIVLALSVVVTALCVLAVWRVQKSRTARAVTSDGYSAELMGGH